MHHHIMEQRLKHLENERLYFITLKLNFRPRFSLRSNGRVQWDPARDLMSREDKRLEPRKMLRKRAIQIGLKGSFSRLYVESIVRIEDVTDLAKMVGEAHGVKNAKARQQAIEGLAPSLPVER